MSRVSTPVSILQSSFLYYWLDGTFPFLSFFFTELVLMYLFLELYFLLFSLSLTTCLTHCDTIYTRLQSPDRSIAIFHGRCVLLHSCFVSFLLISLPSNFAASHKLPGSVVFSSANERNERARGRKYSLHNIGNVWKHIDIYIILLLLQEDNTTQYIRDKIWANCLFLSIPLYWWSCACWGIVFVFLQFF